MDQLLLSIAVLGIVALAGVFWRMKPGFGPYNLRIVGIVVVAVLASLLGLRSEAGITAAIGVLGAIVGYLFGLQDKASS